MIETNKLARTWQDGTMAQARVEDLLEEILEDQIHHIGTDYYDNSLEVYFSCEPSDLEIGKFSALVKEMGFGRFWLNFLDGSEQYVQLSPGVTIYDRGKVANPKWTEEKMKERDLRP